MELEDKFQVNETMGIVETDPKRDKGRKRVA